MWTGHIVLHTARLAAAARFYEQIGMRSVAVAEKFAALEMRGGTHLAIRYDPGQVAPGPVGWDLMVDDIDLIHDMWQAEGVPGYGHRHGVAASRLRAHGS
jgi:catechol 2,3-dioxygenase-like lactoylglutathione lyase family enzyme